MPLLILKFQLGFFASYAHTISQGSRLRGQVAVCPYFGLQYCTKAWADQCEQNTLDKYHEVRGRRVNQ